MKQSIKLWTYNLFLRPPPIKNNEDDFKTQRFQMIMDRISQYDICCFQELFQTATFRSEDMVATAINKGFHYWKLSQQTSFFSGKPVDSGLAVISRHPILQSHFESYGIGILSDSASDKGYIYCKIQINGCILHLFNTHLQASYHTPGKQDLRDLSIAARKKQCSILKNRIKQILSKHYVAGDLVMVVGDFNIDATLQKYSLRKDCPIKCTNPLEFHEYSELIQLLQGRHDGSPIFKTPYKVHDLLLENLGTHQPTYGEQEKCVLTDKDEFGITERLDYIFMIKQEKVQLKLQPQKKTCVVQKHQVKGMPFVQLSDHFALSVEIRSMDKNEKQIDNKR